MNNKINILPEHIVNQIKAGEVIERPANIIKEIIENSLDAHATFIDLHITDNGLGQISLLDNGQGISYENLPYAFLRHATSKLENFDDLYQLFTYGFRGEALASIASISKLSCQSTIKTGETSSLEIHGGEIKHHLKREKKQQAGTNLHIKDLFFNTPVRLRFNQSQRSEKRQIEKTIKTFLLSNPQVLFHIKYDEQDKKIYQKTTHQERIKEVFFKKKNLNNHLHKVEKAYDQIEIKAYISDEANHGYSNKEQFLFVNGRYFEDKRLHNLICRSLHSLWPDKAQGHYALFITLPPEQIDVNVHPRKTQVKFQSAHTLYSFIAESLKTITTSSSLDTNSPVSFTNQTPPTMLFDEKSAYFEHQDLKPQNPQDNFPSFQTSSLEDHWNKLALIDNQFLFLSSPQKDFFILDTFKFAHYEITTKLSQNDLPRTPLLISEMVEIEKLNSQELAFLNAKGFELDWLSHKQYALRSIPQFLINFHYQHFIFDIISYLSRPKSDFVITSSPYHSFESIFQSLENHFLYLSTHNIIQQVTSEKLKKLWT